MIKNILVYPIKVVRQPFKNYCYLIVHAETNDAILIDPAWEIDKIEAVLKTTQAKLSTILLTHHHYDHVNLADHFAKRYRIPVRIAKEEIDYYHFMCVNLVPIEQSHELMLGNIKVKPLVTPGHTKGAMCYWIDDALFSGDTLFIEGCGICSAKGGDASAMFDSIEYLKSKIPKETLIYPGHSFGQEPGQLFSYLLQNNFYFQFKSKEDFIRFRMRKKQQGLFAFK
jgi:glyoxylase-like metal-dependent hydrolase (beta-lactamase superfamily II)